jgi:hypothetical protein
VRKDLLPLVVSIDAPAWENPEELKNAAHSLQLLRDPNLVSLYLEFFLMRTHLTVNCCHAKAFETVKH